MEEILVEEEILDEDESDYDDDIADDDSSAWIDDGRDYTKDPDCN